ncbi:MAG: SDR family NAD(P)-dependent oxidoreductase [Cyclobacteriaceae bacterium]
MKHVVISGIGGNLGKDLEAYFVNAGYRVTGIWSPGKKPDDKKEFGFEADLRDESSAATCIQLIRDKVGPIDVVLAVAGGFESGTLDETNLESVKKMIALNFDTAWNLVRPVLKLMKKDFVPGRIVLIGARPAFEPERAKNMVAYALSKSLLNDFASIVNADSGSSGIVCSVIVPGTIDTPQNRSWAGDSDTSSWVTTTEIARAIEYLASPEGSKLRAPVLKLYGD